VVTWSRGHVGTYGHLWPLMFTWSRDHMTMWSYDKAESG